MEKSKSRFVLAEGPDVALKEIHGGRRYEAGVKAWLKSLAGDRLINRALSGEVAGLEIRLGGTSGQLTGGDVKLLVSAGDSVNRFRILSVDRQGAGAVWKPAGEEVLHRFPPKRLEAAEEEALEGLAKKLAYDNAFRATYHRIGSYQLPKMREGKTVRERLEAAITMHEAILKAVKA